MPARSASCLSVQVVVRVRPPLARELAGYRPFENAVLVDPSQKVITLSENLQSIANNGVLDGLVRTVLELLVESFVLESFGALATKSCCSQLY